MAGHHPKPFKIELWGIGPTHCYFVKTTQRILLHSQDGESLIQYNLIFIYKKRDPREFW